MLSNIFSYRVKKIISLSPTVSQLVLIPSNKRYLTFAAGQYLKVIHHDKTESPLSIACAPNKKHQIEILLSSPKKNKTALDILHMAHNEHALLISGPFGTNTSEKLDLTKPIIFFVKGTGFAPAKALLQELQQKKTLPAIYLFFDQPPTKVLEIFPELSHTQVYASGSTEMVLATFTLFEKNGLKKKYFYSDVFDYTKT